MSISVGTGMRDPTAEYWETGLTGTPEKLSENLSM